MKPSMLRRLSGALQGAGAALILCAAGVAILADGGPSYAATAGTITIITPLAASGGGAPLPSGGSATQWTLLPPTGGACTGDTVNGGYRVQSYMVPSTVDPNTLTFDADGPVPQGLGASLRIPLFFGGGTPFVTFNTAIETTPGAGGLIVNLPGTFDFTAFTIADIPAGRYNVGLACTVGSPGPTQLDKFWNTQIDIVADATDTPSGFRWTAVAAQQTTTTTTTVAASTTTTTLAGGTTTTTVAGGTTTTTLAGGTTTTTVAGGTTTTTIAGSSATSTTVRLGSGGGTTSGGTGSGGVVASQGQVLANTGAGSTVVMLVLGVVLLMCGRMVVLLGRRTPVLPYDGGR